MNKKINLLLLIVIFWGMISNNILAQDLSTIYLQASKYKINSDEEIEITVNLNNKSTAAFNFMLYFDSTRWDYITNENNVNLKDDYLIFVWHDEEGGKSPKTGELASFKFKSKSDGVSKFYLTGEFYDSEGGLIETNANSIQVEIQNQKPKDENINQQMQDDMVNNEIANLEILAIENATLNPPFDKNKLNYEAEVSEDVNDLNVFAIPENENAKVKISGNKDIKEGKNEVVVTVSAKNGAETKKYTVEVYKRNKKEEIAYKEEQESQQKKVEKAYEIERLKSQSQDSKYESEANSVLSQNNIQNKNKSTVFMVLLVLVILIFAILVWGHYTLKSK